MRSLFPHALLDSLHAAPGSPAFEHGSRTVTRGELLGLIRRLSWALREAGLGPGSGLAIRTAVTPEAFAAHLAAHVVGCRVVGIRPGYPPAQLAHILAMDVTAILTDETGAPDLRKTGAHTGAHTEAHTEALPVLDLSDLLAHPDGELTVTARPDDVAALVFTSGSTGHPKGCAITYRALSEHWAWQPATWSPVAAEFATAFRRYLLFGTLASMVVMEFLAPCLLGGGTAIIPEQDGRPLFPYAIERHKITGSIITVARLNQLLDLLAKEPVDVSSLEALMVSGSPISAARLAEARDRLGPVVYQGYGQTEAGSISMLTPADTALGSVGRPHPGVEIGIRHGEIHVRSPYLMAGYWGQEQETREVLRDGWLRTRDLGHLDENGYLYLTGRARDVVMVNAMVVYAGPIEQALTGHPGVREAYVVGTPDERTGEAVHAFVVPAAQEPDREVLKALVRSELGDDSVPQTITMLPAVPLALSGKPDKAALRRLL